MTNNRDKLKGPELERWLLTAIMSILFALIVLVMTACTGEGATITDNNAIHAIMGEARGESYEGKLYLASALRNRGTLSGVYGMRVPIEKLEREPEWVWEECRRAWQESQENRVTQADHWGGTACDAAWIQSAKESGRYNGFITIGNQVFFKEL